MIIEPASELAEHVFNPEEASPGAVALGPPRRDLEKCHAFALCTDTVSTFKFVHFVLCLLS